MSTASTIPQWVDTAAMAGVLGIHPKTLLALRRHPRSPFVEGREFRRAGISTKARFQWRIDLAEQAFTGFRRIDPSQVETFRNAGAR
jgi:hypothetical protein